MTSRSKGQTARKPTLLPLLRPHARRQDPGTDSVGENWKPPWPKRNRRVGHQARPAVIMAGSGGRDRTADRRIMIQTDSECLLPTRADQRRPNHLPRKASSPSFGRVQVQRAFSLAAANVESIHGVSSYRAEVPIRSRHAKGPETHRKGPDDTITACRKARICIEGRRHRTQPAVSESHVDRSFRRERCYVSSEAAATIFSNSARMSGWFEDK